MRLFCQNFIIKFPEILHLTCAGHDMFILSLTVIGNCPCDWILRYHPLPKRYEFGITVFNKARNLLQNGPKVKYLACSEYNVTLVVGVSECLMDRGRHPITMTLEHKVASNKRHITFCSACKNGDTIQ